MKIRGPTRLAMLATMAVACSAVFAQGRTDLGKREFDANCAVCHGADGKGGGPYTEALKRSPPDLTSLARRNGGIFPVARAFEVIEGAGPGHGTRDMPIWGQKYSIDAAAYYMDVDYDQRAVVRARILTLVEYLNRLQAK